MNDSCERGIPPQARDVDLQRSAAVDRAGEYLVAAHLLGRQRLAGHGRLIDVADSLVDTSVERNLLAGLDDDDVSDAHILHRHALLDAVPLHERFSGREIHQRPNRATGALHGARFEHLRQREQKHHGCTLGPFAEGHRTRDRDQHQNVDVEYSRAQRIQRTPGGEDATRKDRNGERQPDDGGRGSRELQREAGSQSGPRYPDDALTPWRRRRRTRLLVLEPRTHASLCDGFCDVGGRQLRGVILDGEALADDVRGQRLEPGQLGEAAFEDGHLFVTVHAFDLEHGLGVQFADSADGRRHRSCSSTCVSACWNSSMMC